jgi:hypothetical protein
MMINRIRVRKMVVARANSRMWQGTMAITRVMVVSENILTAGQIWLLTPMMGTRISVVMVMASHPLMREGHRVSRRCSTALVPSIVIKINRLNMLGRIVIS